MADKDRTRLTVYVDRKIEERFRNDAERMYRSLSDHMNAILAEYYANKDGRNGATNAEEDSGSGG